MKHSLAKNVAMIPSRLFSAVYGFLPVFACRRRDGSEHGLYARAWIKIVAQRVPDEIEREHGQHHGQRGKEYEVRRVEQVRTAVVQHGSPTRCGRRNAETEGTHSCLCTA